MKKFICIFVMFLVFAAAANGQEADENTEKTEVDHLALATLMIFDGRLDKAEAELALVDTAGETFDAAGFYTVRGVLASKKEAHEKAIENYLTAIDATKAKIFAPPKVEKKKKYLFSVGKSEADTDPTPVPAFDAEKIKKEKLEKLHVYLSQAYYKIKDYANTVKHLDLAGDRGRNRAALFALRAECHWKIEQFDRAISALNLGLKLFPDDATLLKQKYYYFADLGLYQSAIESAKHYMKVIEAGADEYIILAQLLIEVGQDDEALKILEMAKAKFSGNAKISMLLGHIYMGKDKNFVAAQLFKDAAYNDKQYLKDAVEMHRRVKDFSHAIYLNTQMADKMEKLRQKVAIYLDRG